MGLSKERRKEIDSIFTRLIRGGEIPTMLEVYNAGADLLVALAEAERGLAAARGEASFFQTAHEQVESRVRELEEENARLRAALRYTWTAWKVGQRDYFDKLKSIRAILLGGGEE